MKLHIQNRPNREHILYSHDSVGQIWTQEDADIIVHHVNWHDDLIAVVEAARLMLAAWDRVSGWTEANRATNFIMPAYVQTFQRAQELRDALDAFKKRRR